MPDEARLGAAFAVALIAAFAATPLAISVAVRTNFLDHPRGFKQHAAPTPYLGGAAVLGGFLVGAITIGGDFGRLAPIPILAFALWVVGTLDDHRRLPVAVRLGAECVAAAGLWATDLGWTLFGSDAVNLVVTIVWTVSLVNAFNLIDNADGAATVVAAVTAVAVAVIAGLDGDVALAALALGLAGACCGFLPYNLTSPARIFLGDGGSLPLGFALAGAIMALPSEEDVGWPLFLAAVLLAGLPVLDTALVVISRARRRAPVFRGGRDHLAHRLLARGPSTRTVAVALGIAQGALGLVAIGVIQLGRGSIIAAWCLWFVAGATLVAYLESRVGAAPATAAEATVDDRRRRAVRGRSPTVLEGGLIALIALTCGLSPLLAGFYRLSIWGPITLLMLAALLGLAIARPAAPRRSAVVALAGIGLLAAWAVLSAGWAESGEQALVDGSRWVLYAALFGFVVLLLREDRVAHVLVAALTGAIGITAATVLLQMLLGDGPGLFIKGRLYEPLEAINGEAAYFLLGFWPLVTVAERARRRVWAGAALGGATLLLCLVLLCQTRSVVPALAASAVVLLVVAPGRVPRLLALLLVAGGVALAAGPLLDVYQASDSGEVAPGAGTVRSAALAALVAACAVGLVWGFAGRAIETLSAETRGRARVATGWIAAAIVAVGVVGVVVLTDAPDRARSELSAFTELGSDDGGTTRLVSGGGNRYDYWRIAARQFRDRPLAGVGAGNFDTTYYLERTTAENVRQPHSLALQTLGELGLVGVVALALLLAGIAAGAVGRLRGQSPGATGLTIAAGGMFLVWIVQASVDWLHLIPGLTGIALCAGAVLVGPLAASGPRPGRRRVRAAGLGALAVAVVLGAIVAGRATLADHYRAEASEALPSNPAEAIRRADDALAMDDESMAAYYVKAAAFARLNRYDDARAALAESARREPHDHVPWALLGDLAVRHGDVAQARDYYRRAARLNPRDEQLADLARDPRGAGR